MVIRFNSKSYVFYGIWYSMFSSLFFSRGFWKMVFLLSFFSFCTRDIFSIYSMNGVTCSILNLPLKLHEKGFILFFLCHFYMYISRRPRLRIYILCMVHFRVVVSVKHIHIGKNVETFYYQSLIFFPASETTTTTKWAMVVLF